MTADELRGYKAKAVADRADSGLSLSDAAKLYASIRDIRPDEGNMSRWVTTGKLQRPITELDVYKLAVSTPARRKGSAVNRRAAKITCPVCHEKTDRLVYRNNMCRSCFEGKLGINA